MKNNTGEQIARQSMLKLVIDTFNQQEITSFKDAVAITNVLVDYVSNGYSKNIGDRLEAIDNYIETKKTK